MRNKKDGVTLESIVDKETYTGTSNNINVNTVTNQNANGSVYMTPTINVLPNQTIIQSKRARTLSKPDEKSAMMFYLKAYTLLGISSLALFFYACLHFLFGVSDNIVLDISFSLFYVSIFIAFMVMKSSSPKRKAIKDENAQKKAIYDRLRFVEDEEIVFDPKTMKEVPAKRKDILALIDVLYAA